MAITQKLKKKGFLDYYVRNAFILSKVMFPIINRGGYLKVKQDYQKPGHF